MKTRLLLLACSLLFFATALTPTPRAVDYVSAWTYVSAGQSLALEHGLGVRPLHVEIWVAHFVAQQAAPCQADFTNVFPIYESDDLETLGVTPERVSLHNHGDNGYCVQVVASP